MKHHLISRRAVLAGSAATGALALTGMSPAWADIAWKKYAGTKLEVILAKGPRGDNLQKYIKEFSELSGIEVESEQIPEQQQRQKVVIELASGKPSFDVIHLSYHVQKRQFEKAGWLADLTTFMNTHPFQAGFLGTASQVGAGSSAGMVANGKAAMELQGDWDPGVMAPLTSNKSITSQLGWFPFPSVPGGAGSATTVLGGGDGFSCTTVAPAATCAEFLKYIDSAPVQTKVVGANVGLPANPAASAALTPAQQQVLTYSHAAPYIQTYFDIAFPTNVGQALDAAIANYFAGQGSAQSIITAVSQAKSQQ